METQMVINQFEESMTKIFSLIDDKNISELEKSIGIDKDIYNCYGGMSRYIFYKARDARHLKIHLDSWMKDYNLPADVIRKILKKIFNTEYIDEDEYTDEEIERFIDKSSQEINSIILTK